MRTMSVARVLTTLALLTLAGCASLSEKECLGGDWRGIGVADGREGYGTERMSEHREACGKYGVQPDEPAYLAGRDEGLRSYCTANSGFRVGNSGASYGGVCPPLLEGGFLSAFEHGRELYLLRRAFEEVDGAMDSRDGDLRRVEDDLRATERAAAAEGDQDRRRDLVREVRRLAEQRGRLRGEIDALRAEYYERRDRLEQYRSELRRHPDYAVWDID